MKQQSGIALVVVLLVVALVSVIATGLSGQLQREIQRSSNIQSHGQALQYAKGLEHLAIVVLQQNGKDNPKRKDLSQTWAAQGLYFPVDGGDLTGTITDRNHCFNVNSLVDFQAETKIYLANKDSVNYVLYKRLLASLGLPITLAESLRDWLDSDAEPNGLEGAEDEVYEVMVPPYRSANNLITNISELKLIQGYTNEVMEKLSSYVCALPEAGYLKLNANTLDPDKPELLMMFIDGLAVDAASALLVARDNDGYDNMAQFWQQHELTGLDLIAGSESIMQLNSDYFYLQAKANIDRSYVGLTTLFKQRGIVVEVLWRQYGRIEQ